VGAASIAALCQCFGYSRQGFYKRLALENRQREQGEAAVAAVRQIRQRQPRVGGRKLYRMIQPEGYGRDRFFDLLREEELLIEQRRSYRRTTYAGRCHFPNLVRDVCVERVGDVVVSDITYLETDEGFRYLFLTTDLYSRKIVGYALSRDLTSAGAQKAMQMALRELPSGDIHHSDRGWQYGAGAFQELLNEHGMRPSMTEEDHVYENSVAERVNGILKTEFLLGGCPPTVAVLEKLVAQAIYVYNNERLHTSLGYKTPAEVWAENLWMS